MPSSAFEAVVKVPRVVRCVGSVAETSCCVGSNVEIGGAYRTHTPVYVQVSTGGEGFFAVNSSLVNADPWGIPASAANQGRYW